MAKKKMTIFWLSTIEDKGSRKKTLKEARKREHLFGNTVYTIRRKDKTTYNVYGYSKKRRIVRL